LITQRKCQCKPCVVQGLCGDADMLAIVPYVAKKNVDPCGNSVSQDCICCNVSRIVSYELVIMVSSSLCKTSYGIKFLWN
jgi:hypothetical protein